uniref:BTB domain-containing protein n=1 Tax=Cercocebus atys TaxID=9531 RepID=A0A2K5NGH1_CERAT
MEAEETTECLQEFREWQDCFTDITLIVDGHHLKAHKAVLAACSKHEPPGPAAFYKFFLEFTQEPLVEIEAPPYLQLPKKISRRGGGACSPTPGD